MKAFDGGRGTEGLGGEEGELEVGGATPEAGRWFGSTVGEEEEDDRGDAIFVDRCLLPPGKSLWDIGSGRYPPPRISLCCSLVLRVEFLGQGSARGDGEGY